MKITNPRFDTTLALLIFCIGIYIALFFTLSILRYKAFFSYEWEDLAEANIIAWNLSHGHLSHYLQFYTHERVQIVLFMFLIVGLYFFMPHIYTFFFTTTFSLAIATIPLYFLALKLLEDKRAALLLSIAYLFYAPKNSLNFLDGDTSIYTIPLLLFAFYTALLGRKAWFIVCSILVMLCKTETPFYITVLMTYLFMKRRVFNKIDSKVYFFLGLISILFLVSNVIASNKLGREPICESCTNISNDKSSLSSGTFFPLPSYFSQIKIEGLLKLFLPVLLFPLFTPEILLGFPSIFLILNTENFLFQRAHYISDLVPFIFIGTILFIKKISLTYQYEGEKESHSQAMIRKRTTLSSFVLIGCFLSNFFPNIIGGPHQDDVYPIEDRRFLNVSNIYDPKFYIMDEEDRIAWRMVNMIPKDPLVSVAATGDLLVPLSSRKKIVEFLDNQYDYYDVDYILIHGESMYMGAGQYVWDEEEIDKKIEELLHDKNWETVAIEDCFYLFKKKKL